MGDKTNLSKEDDKNMDKEEESKNFNNEVDELPIPSNQEQINHYIYPMQNNYDAYGVGPSYVIPPPTQQQQQHHQQEQQQYPNQQYYPPPQTTYYSQYPPSPPNSYQSQSPPTSPVVITTHTTYHSKEPIREDAGHAMIVTILFILGFFFFFPWCINIAFVRSKNPLAKALAITSLVLIIVFLVLLITIIPVMAAISRW